MTAVVGRDSDARNELGSLPPEMAARCAEAGVVFARLHRGERPFLITAMRPLSAVACEALPAAEQVLAQESRGLAVALQTGAALAHGAVLQE